MWQNHSGIQRKLLSEGDITYSQAFTLAQSIETAESDAEKLGSRGDAVTTPSPSPHTSIQHSGENGTGYRCCNFHHQLSNVRLGQADSPRAHSHSSRKQAQNVHWPGHTGAWSGFPEHKVQSHCT